VSQTGERGIGTPLSGALRSGAFRFGPGSGIGLAVIDSLTAHAQAKIDGLQAKSLARTLKPTHRLDGVWVERGGRRLISFSCNDYLGLSHHPAVKAAAVAAIGIYGAGGGRLAVGHRRPSAVS
jgi:8-amino-7-oxononanoate synthase